MSLFVTLDTSISLRWSLLLSCCRGSRGDCSPSTSCSTRDFQPSAVRVVKVSLSHFSWFPVPAMTSSACSASGASRHAVSLQMLCCGVPAIATCEAIVRQIQLLEPEIHRDLSTLFPCLTKNVSFSSVVPLTFKMSDNHMVRVCVKESRAEELTSPNVKNVASTLSVRETTGVVRVTDWWAYVVASSVEADLS